MRPGSMMARSRGSLPLLDRDGEEARVVGGAVRNALLGYAVDEIDVATTAVPEEVVRRVEAAGWKAIPTGIEHGTVTVVIDGKPFEVTTLRQDVETYGRKAKVVFGRDWRADAERRDFTINALSAIGRRPRFTTMSAASPISRRAGCASSASRQADRGRLSAHPAFFPISCLVRRGRARSGRIARLHSRARGARDAVARAGADGVAQTAARAARDADARGHGGNRHSRHGAGRRAATREFREHGESRGRDGARGRRRAPIGRAWRYGDGRRRAAGATASFVECGRRAAVPRWSAGGAYRRQCGDQPAHALLYRLGPQSFADRVLRRLVALAGGRGRPCVACAGKSPATLDGAEISAQGRRLHPSRRWRQARLWVRPCARRKKLGSRRTFRPSAPRSKRSPTGRCAKLLRSVEDFPAL